MELSRPTKQFTPLDHVVIHWCTRTFAEAKTTKTSSKSRSKSKSKNTLFNVGQCKQYNISSHLKWLLVADKSMHMTIYKIHIK